MHIQIFITRNSSICTADIEGKKHIFTRIKDQNSVFFFFFINKFSRFAIPNHSSPISMSMQSLKKISQKLLKLESGNEALTDGRTDGHSKRFGGYNIIPRGIKSKCFRAEISDRKKTTCSNIQHKIRDERFLNHKVATGNNNKITAVTA